MVHIGAEIEKRVRSQRYPIAKLAREIHRSRPAIYILFKAQSIDTELLLRISQVLHYNFFGLYQTELQPKNLDEPQGSYRLLNQELEHLLNAQKAQIAVLEEKLELQDKLIQSLEARLSNAANHAQTKPKR